MKLINSRDVLQNADQCLREYFKALITADLYLDAIYTDSSCKNAIGAVGLPFKAPVMLELLKNGHIADFLLKLARAGSSLMLMYDASNHDIRLYEKKEEIREVPIPQEVKGDVVHILESVSKWAGTLNADGEHEIDLRTPSPGPHFFVNLLLGNRIGFPKALQTTPKSVVDRLGGGSFRSHAATQVLATRWDMRQEENGFPVNRQFYLTEGCRKIFYSADPYDKNIESAKCVHSQNQTVIKYKTGCGLEIIRTIFILPQKEGLPIATEVQQVEVVNTGKHVRRLRLVYTGMFGSAAPGALQEDVLYSNIVMQAGILRGDDGSVRAVVPDYFREVFSEDNRFHTTLFHLGDKVMFPGEFCTDYNEFIGNGTVENPKGLLMLSNRLYRKGPGFFAVAGEFELAPGQLAVVDNFTGLISRKANPDYNEGTLKQEVESLIRFYSKPGAVKAALEENRSFLLDYSGLLSVRSSDKMLDTYLSSNLPFQVLYQTFVSRSFCQTQKGYREIGFREIQDIYASMYYFVSAGKQIFVKELLKEWFSKVFDFGFAYHNFFWVGKEAGKWSDDALWFIQAVCRYIRLTGDMGFLDEVCDIAGTSPIKTRPVYDTIKAILQYSGEISIGKHGLPLLDYADWNDCLKLDADYVNGIEKERLYAMQVEKGKHFGEGFDSELSESVMNAFLLKTAIDDIAGLAHKKRDSDYEQKLKYLSQKLYDNLQQHAWHNDFFARVLFNRYENNEFRYLGAKGDGLSSNPEVDGVYFLNSFSWAVLSGSASETQIESMINVIDRVLKTPFGLKLMSPAELGRISNNTAAGEYFQGDRENGGIFKHACMMATRAMFKAAKEVRDSELAARLSRMAYWMVDLVLPYNSMKAPYTICGNPRFCTQYNNSETGENVGPMLSGTSTWLTLTLLSALGLDFTQEGIVIDPVLKEEETGIDMTLRMYGAVYKIGVIKPEGFCRLLDKKAQILFDGARTEANIIPAFYDGKVHSVVIDFNKG